MIHFDDYTIEYGSSKIVLRPFTLEPNAEHPDLLGAYVRVDVIENVDFPAGIFVWERYLHMEDNNDIASRDRPVCVAKPSDLDTFPMDNPNPERKDLPPFFRSTWFEMTIGSPMILLETWEHIKVDAGLLVKTVFQLGGP
jgi:hypothetical protein